ncbi:hypothetical protein L210DRAFT_3394790 [Boletus edulis BED1]|uniref:Uncharacterized protein n=1 Tax=Boletus edulis BED1 TaxID=1328754 RepID=A0AAD4BZI5_BOLED|nr:hypothetical protein L210DRAFT_3394790 [Boletus edulis BED1]
MWQCSDLLEHNLAHKHPIQVFIGNKGLEVRPLAVNKVWNPDAEFIHCAGDDGVRYTILLSALH